MCPLPPFNDAREAIEQKDNVFIFSVDIQWHDSQSGGRAIVREDALKNR